MNKFLYAACLMTLLSPAAAQAEPKSFFGPWWSSHWVNQDFKPYYQDGQRPQTTQWRDENWQPQDWIDARQGNMDGLLKQWYEAAIIRSRYMDDDVPYVDVGINFYHLSGYDKGRILATIDHIFRATDKTPKTIFVKDHITKKVIGVYTAQSGLVLE